MDEATAIAQAEAEAAAIAQAEAEVGLVDPYAPPAMTPQPNVMDAFAPPGMAETKFAEPADRQLTGAEAVQLFSQAGLRGAADLAGSVYDLPNAAFMGGQWLGNEVGQWFGAPETPSLGIDQALGITGADEQPFNLSDFIANTASEADSFIPPIPGHERVPPMTREDMGAAEPLYDVARFAAGAAGGGGLLADLSRGAKARIDDTGQGMFGDSLLRPYMDRPAAAIARDAGAGGGAAIGQDVAENFTDDPLSQFVASLLGAVGGSGLVATTQAIPRGIGNVIDKMKPADRIIPVDPDTRIPFSKSQENLAAAELQRRAGDRLPEAQATFDENFAELQQSGVPPEATPTFGLLTEDPGLIQLERGYRTDIPDQFIQRDQGVRDFAANQVEGLRNPNADMKAVSASLDATERSLDMTRDAEALPLLKQAEQAGVAVDAAPVASLIDEKLLSAKRPPVRKALAEARAFLNTVGGEELDNSVSGLYEARKAINDVIEGRGENPTGRFAAKELIEVREALDAEITRAVPEFGAYLQKYREGSEPLDAFKAPAVEAARGPTNARAVARKILANDIDGADEVRQIQALIEGDPNAQEALRAAFAEEVARKITTGAEAGDEGYEVSLASIAKEFKQKQDVLAAAFSGTDDMNVLQQVNSLLGHFRGLSKKATPGSDTASLLKAPDIFGDSAGILGKSVQIGIRHVYGDLKGGGILRRFKLMQALVPTAREGANQIAYMAQFNPEVGRYLLGLPVQNIKHIPANWGLRAAIAADLAQEGDNPPEEE